MGFRLTAAALAALLSLTPAAAQRPRVTPTPTPVSPSGVPAIVDVPANLHIRNVGGSDGAGLCVGTSVQLAARFSGVTEMEGFQDWLRRRPGGSIPSQLARDLPAFCQSKGVPVPRWVQHSGGDVAFLELIFRTRRACGMTWSPYHMVTGAHLDANTGCIIDNNNPGNWEWCDRAEFLRQWGPGNGHGGWAVVFLGPPPPPLPGGAPAPTPYPTPAPAPTPQPRPRPNPNCPICPRWEPLHIGGAVYHKLVDDETGRLWGVWEPDGWHPSHDGRGWTVHAEGNCPVPPPGAVPYGGIPAGALSGRDRYWVDGVEVDRAAAVAALVADLTDDSDRYHLTVIAPDEARRKELLATLPNMPGAERCHVQVQLPSMWFAERVRGAAATLQKPAKLGGAVVGTSPDLTPAALTELLKLSDPNYKPPPPKPEPGPAPRPCPCPCPKPCPCPEPCPCPKPGPDCPLCPVPRPGPAPAPPAVEPAPAVAPPNTAAGPGVLAILLAGLHALRRPT